MNRTEFRAAHRAFRTANPRLPMFDEQGTLTAGTHDTANGLRMHRWDGAVSTYREQGPSALSCAVMVLCFSTKCLTDARVHLDLARSPEFRGALPLPA